MKKSLLRNCGTYVYFNYDSRKNLLQKFCASCSYKNLYKPAALFSNDTKGKQENNTLQMHSRPNFIYIGIFDKNLNVLL